MIEDPTTIQRRPSLPRQTPSPFRYWQRPILTDRATVAAWVALTLTIGAVGGYLTGTADADRILGRANVALAEAERLHAEAAGLCGGGR